MVIVDVRILNVELGDIISIASEQCRMMRFLGFQYGRLFARAHARATATATAMRLQISEPRYAYPDT